MASALVEGHVVTESTLLTCTLCNQELKKPKLLPCQHSFCFQCLVRHHDDVVEGEPFCCPTCHKVIDLEDNSAESIKILPDNYLFDITRESGECVLYSNLRCSPCNEGKKVTNATHKCLDCGDTLCQQCNEWHCRFTATKHHQVVPLTDLKKRKFQEEYSAKKVLHCNVHSSEERKVPLSSYCDDCRSLVCVECMQGDHKSHGFSNIHSEREKLQSSSKEKVSNLQRSAREQKKRIGNIQTAITDTKQKRSQQEAEIYDTATELYAVVDKIKDEKLAELKSHYDEELEYLNKLLEEEQNKQSSLQATVAFVNTFLEKCSDSDFLYHENDVKERMESSQRGLKYNFNRSIVNVERKEITLITRAIEDVFGKIKTQTQSFLHKCRIGTIKSNFKWEIDMTKIYGLSYDKDREEILVAGCKDGEDIDILDEEGRFKRSVQCTNAGRLSGIAVKGSLIHVAVCRKHLRKVSVLDQKGTVQNCCWLPEDDQDSKGLLGLVVDDDNGVFIASNKTDKIYKWNPGEDKMAAIIPQARDNAIKMASYLCLTPNGQLVVSSYGSMNLQVYSKEGVFQWQYDGQDTGHGLNKPGGVCCDEDGYIYVVDKGNCTIQVIYDKKCVGVIPIDQEVKDEIGVPLISTPEGGLIYAYSNKIIKISCWDQ